MTRNTNKWTFWFPFDMILLRKYRFRYLIPKNNLEVHSVDFLVPVLYCFRVTTYCLVTVVVNEREMQSVPLQFFLFVCLLMNFWSSFHEKHALQLVLETIYNINTCNSYHIKTFFLAPRYCGLSLLRTLNRGPEGVRSDGSWLVVWLLSLFFYPEFHHSIQILLRGEYTRSSC